MTTMRNILLISFILLSFNAFSQNTEVNTTTVVYDIGEEGNKQNLSYSIENGILRIKGYMFVNCCGVHLLNCLIEDTYIYLSRTDMGELCDCQAPHLIDISIPNIAEGEYKIFLSDYACVDGTADYAEIKASSISSVESRNFTLKYTDENIIITISDKDIKGNCEVKVFNTEGKEILQTSSVGNIVTIPAKILDEDYFICRISRENNNYSIKLSKKQMR